MPTMDWPTPHQSQRPARGEDDSGRNQPPSAMITAATGRFSRNADCQPKSWTSRPPMTGPSAMPPPKTAAHTANARARSRASVKTFRRIDSVDGMIAAPPTPSRARAAITCHASVEKTARSEANAKIEKPVSSIRLRPHRSPSAPAVTSRPDRARA